jgi:hypothetical protein
MNDFFYLFMQTYNINICNIYIQTNVYKHLLYVLIIYIYLCTHIRIHLFNNTETYIIVVLVKNKNIFMSICKKEENSFLIKKKKKCVLYKPN